MFFKLPQKQNKYKNYLVIIVTTVIDMDDLDAAGTNIFPGKTSIHFLNMKLAQTADLNSDRWQKVRVHETAQVHAVGF